MVNYYATTSKHPVQLRSVLIFTEEVTSLAGSPARLGASSEGIACPVNLKAISMISLNELYSFDTSTVDLCLSLFPWEKFRKTKGGTKLHTLLDHHVYIRDLLKSLRPRFLISQWQKSSSYLLTPL